MQNHSSISVQEKTKESSAANGAQKNPSPFFAPLLQPKLTVNQPNDVYEQEADAVAEKVMRMPEPKAKEPFFQPKPVPVAPVQKGCAACEQEEPEQKEAEEEDQPVQLKEFEVHRKCAACEADQNVQKKGQGPAVVTPVSSLVQQVTASPGLPLDRATRTFMETRFGADFSNVQIHNDAAAHQSSVAINALAYTHTNHIVFAPGQYQPGTVAGKGLLAHELAHVIQQGSRSTVVQRRLGNFMDYFTPYFPASPGFIVSGENLVTKVLDLDYSKVAGKIDADAYQATIKRINDSVLKGISKPEQDVSVQPGGDENEALVQQLNSSSLSEARAAGLALIRLGEKGWKSLLEALNHEDSVIRIYAAAFLSENIKTNRRLLKAIASYAQNGEGVLRVSAVRVLEMAGYGNYYDNKNFTQSIVQKIEFIKIFFNDLPLPGDGWFRAITFAWYAKTKAGINKKAALAIWELTNNISYWNNLVDIAQVVEITYAGMAVASRMLSFMRSFNVLTYNLNNQGVYYKVANITMLLGDDLNEIFNIKDEGYQITAMPTTSLMELTHLVTACEQIPQAIAVAAVGDLMINLYRVEENSADLIEALRQTKSPQWLRHVITIEEVIGIANGIQAALPPLSKLAWDSPMTFFDVSTELSTEVNTMLTKMSAIAFSLNTYSLKYVIDDSHQVRARSSAEALKNKAILKKYLEDAEALIAKYINSPKELGAGIEALREKEEYKAAIQWVGEFSLDEEDYRLMEFAVKEILITLAAILTGSIFARLAALGMTAVATTGAIGAAAAESTIVGGGIVLGAETLGFVLTEKLLNQLIFGKGDWDTFLSDFVKAYLLFGVLKGSGKLYEALVASKRIPYGIEKLGKFTTEVVSLTAMQGVFIAWENLSLDAEHQKEFNLLEQLGHNALFLIGIKIGMVALQKLPPPVLSGLEKKMLTRLEARTQSLEAKFSQLQKSLPGTKETQSLYNEIRDLLDVKREAMKSALANNIFKGNDAEIAATQASIESIGNRLAELDNLSGLFKFNIRPTKVENGYTFEGDADKLKEQLLKRVASSKDVSFEKSPSAEHSEIYVYKMGNEPPVYLEKVAKPAAKKLTPAEVAEVKGLTLKEAVNGFWEAVQKQNFGDVPELKGTAKLNAKISELLEDGWLPGKRLPRSVGEWLKEQAAKTKPSPAESDTTSDTTKPKDPDQPFAELPDGTLIPPDSYSGGYHGTTTPPEKVLKEGLPKRGKDRSLLRHVEENPDTAYRGVTLLASDPVNEGGAAYWAGEGGYVYEIKNVPTWDVNKALQGRVENPGGFGGNRMHGENEYVIPAEVTPDKIKRWGVVVRTERGWLRVEWHTPPEPGGTAPTTDGPPPKGPGTTGPTDTKAPESPTGKEPAEPAKTENPPKVKEDPKGQEPPKKGSGEKRFLKPEEATGEGYLTPDEVAQLQAIANKYKTKFYVVGSRAEGRGRNIFKTDLPVGKDEPGSVTRSDIDVRIDSQADIDSGGRLSHDIANVGNGAGKSMNIIGRAAEPPAILFEPK